MILIRRWSALLFMSVLMSFTVFSADNATALRIDQPSIPLVGSWSFSGTVANESGDRYGYFFQMQRQGVHFHVKTALIDGESNQSVLFYEESETIEDPAQLRWRVGHSFIRYNPINDSWIFGVKSKDGKGFNFKVDMLKQSNKENKTLVLRPGVELQAVQTSRLNGHIQLDMDSKEQFITGNNAWFAKVWFSTIQKSSHDVSTTFCRLSNDNGFYSANLKEADATSAAVAGWRDAAGNKVKMSQFISIKPLAGNQCMLRVALPKLSVKILNTVKYEGYGSLTVAGFFKESPKGFCFITEQSLLIA